MTDKKLPERRLTLDEYKHLMTVWGEPTDPDREGRTWDPHFCTSGTCWTCDEVGRKMQDGTFDLADTEDGVPIWFLPDEYLPEDAADAYAEWLNLLDKKFTDPNFTPPERWS